MARRVYIAELDAHTARLEKKIDGIQNRTVQAGAKMDAAFKRVGAALIASFSAGAIISYAKRVSELAIQVQGVEKAFKRLNDPMLIHNLRKATLGTISDLKLMQSAVFARKMRLPMDLLAKGMEFASLTAIETGQSVEYMMNSFVTGTSRQSIKILDNLGISASELKEEVDKAGDFMTGLGNIMDRELTEMRKNIDPTTVALQKMSAELENTDAEIGKNTLPLVLQLTKAWNFLVTAIAQGGIAHALSKATERDEISKARLGELLKIVGLGGSLMSSRQEGGKKTIAEIREEIAGLREQLDDTVFGSERFLELNKEIKTLEASITEEKKEQLDLTIEQYNIMEDIYERMREMEDEDLILGDVAIGKGKRGSKFWDRGGGSSAGMSITYDKFKGSLQEAESPMNALVSLSNQMASNFQFAGHTFVGQLSNAISMVNSISNIILTVASIFTNIGGFGIGGLFSLFNLEKGGRVTNKFGSVSLSNIPSFASGGSYSTPSYSGPMAGGYPVMVHKNETLDVYNAGQTSKMERMLGDIKNAIVTSNVHLSRKGGGGSQPVIVSIDGKKLFETNASLDNRAARSGRNRGEII